MCNGQLVQTHNNVRFVATMLCCDWIHLVHWPFQVVDAYLASTYLCCIVYVPTWCYNLFANVCVCMRLHRCTFRCLSAHALRVHFNKNCTKFLLLYELYADRNTNMDKNAVVNIWPGKFVPKLSWYWVFVVRRVQYAHVSPSRAHISNWNWINCNAFLFRMYSFFWMCNYDSISLALTYLAYLLRCACKMINRLPLHRSTLCTEYNNNWRPFQTFYSSIQLTPFFRCPRPGRVVFIIFVCFFLHFERDAGSCQLILNY